MIPMDAQRYDLSKRGSPAHEQDNVSDALGALGGTQLAVDDASPIETRSARLPAALTAAKLPPPTITQQRDAVAIPLPLSPLLCSPHDGLTEGDFHISDMSHKNSFIEFPVSSEDNPLSPQVCERPLPSLMSPSLKVARTFMRPMQPQPFFLGNDSSEGNFSRPGSPSPLSPPLSPQSRPTSPRFWKSACPSPIRWPTRPLSPPYHRFNGSASERWGPMSCPTSPVLRPSNPLPSPTSPSASHAMFGTVSQRLRALSSTSRVIPAVSPTPSCPMSPVLQAFNIDNWVPERDPTEGIDVIEIMVTKEISIHVEYINESA